MFAIIARGFLIRIGVNIARLVLAALFVLLWSGCVTQQMVVLHESRPGGVANLRPSSELVLGGGTQLDDTGNPIPCAGCPGFIGPVQGSTILPPPPPDQWSMMQYAARAAPCNLPHGPIALAAVAFYESSYGQHMERTATGNWGYGMFNLSNMQQYGVDPSQATDYHAMLPAMARKLCNDGGASGDLRTALYHYNGSYAYADHVLSLIDSWPALPSAAPSWQDSPALNQFDPRNWANPQNFNIWSPAACSAAALDWMLRAYGTPVTSIDAAIALIGPNTGISSAVGLMDHRGPALKAVLNKAGFETAWNAQLTSDAQLADRLKSGPAMLDGQRWFGVGHWFVAIGADQNGIAVRESSGNNIQYLTWGRLHGEVGWSGWAVGIAPQSPSNVA